MRSPRSLAVIVAMIMAFPNSAFVGYGTSALPPPVTISYRPSLVGIGQVVQISNQSSHHLYNVRVVGRNFEQMASGSVKATDHLPPGGFVEVGWMEFESWTPSAGETIEVYADNYMAPKLSVIPSPQ